MSYVVQNFYNSSKLITITPKFKKLLYLLNNDKFFFFFKINEITKFLNKNFKLLNFNLYFKYFYIYKLMNVFFKFNYELTTNYDNNLFKSIIFFNLNNFNDYLNLNSYKLFKFKYEFFLYNTYFYSIKIINFKINKKFYENYFFFLMLFTTQFWCSYIQFFSFNINFIFLLYDIQKYNFYNGFFFYIYNY